MVFNLKKINWLYNPLASLFLINIDILLLQIAHVSKKNYPFITSFWNFWIYTFRVFLHSKQDDNLVLDIYTQKATSFIYQMICLISLLCQVSFSNSKNFALLNLSSSPSCLFVSFNNPFDNSHRFFSISFLFICSFIFLTSRHNQYCHLLSVQIFQCRH